VPAQLFLQFHSVSSKTRVSNASAWSAFSSALAKSRASCMRSSLIRSVAR
jgi:hypothetical protein